MKMLVAQAATISFGAKFKVCTDVIETVAQSEKLRETNNISPGKDLEKIFQYRVELLI